MKQLFGMSQSGNLKEAVKAFHNPKLLLLMSNNDQFEAHVKELEELFPSVPSIGCIGMSYDTTVVEKGVGVVAFCDGIEAVANVIEQVSTVPVKYIKRIEQDIKTLKASSSNTVCIDFCSGNDACVLTTISGALNKTGISLVGGTGDSGKVSVNGTVYADAMAYALVKSLNGKVRVYKENIYRPMNNSSYIASKTDKSNYIIGELNGKPAKQVYMDTLNIPEKDIEKQTFQNPFGKIVGNDVCIISIKEVSGNALACFRQVNDSDVLCFLELQDYKKIAQETIDNIRNDFQHVSAIFSVNCMFRYLLFLENNILQDYLNTMSTLGSHAGLVGYGEHYNNQFVNQSMSCVVFE